jgi:phosphate uptake regulator
VFERTTLVLGDSDRFLRRFIDTLYRYGYDEVIISFSDQKNLKLVQDSLEELMGFEIVHQSNTSCTVRDITSGREIEDFATILRRIFFMISEMGKNSYDVIKNHQLELMGDIEQFDVTVNKFTNFCERMLNKYGYKDHKKMTLIYYVVCQLEQVADEYRDLCSYLEKKNYVLSKKVLEIYKGTTEHFSEFTELFYKFSAEELFRHKQKRVKLQEAIRAQFESRVDPVDAVVLSHLSTLLVEIQHLTTRII